MMTMLISRTTTTRLALALLALQNPIAGTAAFAVVPFRGVSSPSSGVATTTTTTAPPQQPRAVTTTTTTRSQSSSSSSLAVAGAALELIDPSYNLAIGAFGIGLSAGFLEDLRDGEGEKLLTAKFFGIFAVLFTVFSLFLAFQTTTLRFAFDDDSFSLVRSSGEDTPENIVVGGENRWRYSSFSNYDFLPSRSFPILVYFREDQTPPENREEVPIVVDELEGQVHFFPAISNTKQLEDNFVKHDCKRL